MVKLIEYLTGEQIGDAAKGAITSTTVTQIGRISTALLAVMLEQKGKLQMPAAGDPFASPVPTGRSGGGPPVVT
jgi:hypothetical protein